MTELNRLTLAAASAGLAKGEFSARELTQSCVDAMEARGDLGAFITPTPDLALEAADQADAKRKGGEDAPLLGIPLGIKDLFCTEGVQTTAASKILQGFVPTYESSVTTNLLRDGAVVFTGAIGSLRREKEDVREVREGFECGIVLDGFRDLKEGDVIEAFTVNEIKRTLA